MEQKPVRMFLLERLAELLQGSALGCAVTLRCRIRRLPSSISRIHKGYGIGCEHYEKVARHDSLGVIAHEGKPAMARIGLSAGTLGHILTHRAGRNPDSQFQFNSLAICSSPQVGFSAAIFRINSWRLLGTAGLPAGLDFQRQNKRNPLRCHRFSVSDLTTTSAPRQSNSRLKCAISHLAESSARWGLTLRSWNIARCFRRNKFSATRAVRDLAAERSSTAKSNSTQ